MIYLRFLQHFWLSILVWTYFGSTVTANWGELARAWLQCMYFPQPILYIKSLIISADNEVGKYSSHRFGLSEGADYSQQSFREAERALTSLEEARICKREATLKLISSSTCKDVFKETRREDVEIVQELYAIQLAKCEIESASAGLPQSCQIDFASLSLEIGSRAALQSKIRSCLVILQSKPQWWTSYSNHRRDGYDWCLVMKPGFDYSTH